MAALIPTMNAIKSGSNIGLANKECLVSAGDVILDEAKKNKVKLIPIDSEHNAIFQCMEKVGEGMSLTELSVEKILLTGSGGPFRQTPVNQLDDVTPDMACARTCLAAASP